MRRRLLSFKIWATVVAGVLLLGATVALASPPSGVTPVPNPALKGTVAGKFNINIPGFINFHTKGDLVVAHQVITIAPEGYVGWHSHPGPVLVIVKSGTFRSVQTDCSYKDYTAGQVYVDQGAGHVHNAVNPSATDPLEVSVTYLAPPGTPLRSEADAISC